MKKIEGQTHNVVAEGYVMKKIEGGALIKTTKSGDQPQPYHAPKTQGRNELCTCGSGKKFKNCCGKN